MEKYRSRTYKTLGESVLDWLSGLTDKLEHGSGVLSQEVMTGLGVPVEGFNSVKTDVDAVRWVFDTASRDDGCVGRAAPRTEAALKEDWERWTSTLPLGWCTCGTNGFRRRRLRMGFCSCHLGALC